MVMKRPFVLLVAGALLFSGLMGVGPASAQATAAGSSESGANRSTAPESYRIGPEDVLLISVWKNDALSRSVPVRPDGKISLPLLNDVQAAGLTALELRDVLTQKLAEYLPSPEVAVIVSDIRGALPFRGSAIPSIEDARQRFLAPGGLLIPQRDMLKAAVVEAEEYYEGLATPWQKAVDGLDLADLQYGIVLLRQRRRQSREELLRPPFLAGLGCANGAHSSSNLRGHRRESEVAPQPRVRQARHHALVGLGREAMDAHAQLVEPRLQGVDRLLQDHRGAVGSRVVHQYELEVRMGVRPQTAQSGCLANKGLTSRRKRPMK